MELGRRLKRTDAFVFRADSEAGDAERAGVRLASPHRTDEPSVAFTGRLNQHFSVQKVHLAIRVQQKPADE